MATWEELNFRYSFDASAVGAGQPRPAPGPRKLSNPQFFKTRFSVHNDTGMRYNFQAVWFDSFTLPKTLERDLRYTNYRETVLKLYSFREPAVSVSGLVSGGFPMVLCWFASVFSLFSVVFLMGLVPRGAPPDRWIGIPGLALSRLRLRRKDT